MENMNIDDMRECELVELINQYDCLPRTLAFEIKNRIDEILSKVFRTNKINVHDFSPLKKYIKDCGDVSIPNASYIQADYCKVYNKIEELPVTNITKSELKKFLNAECYSLDKLGDLEMNIDKLVKNGLSYPDNIVLDILEVINCDIMYKKILGYSKFNEIYSERELDITSNLNGIYMTYIKLENILRSNNTLRYSAINDVSILIYVYAKMIGLNSDLTDSIVLNRIFNYIRLKFEDSVYREIINNFNLYYISKLSIVGAMDKLIDISTAVFDYTEDSKKLDDFYDNRKKELLNSSDFNDIDSREVYNFKDNLIFGANINLNSESSFYEDLCEKLKVISNTFISEHRNGTNPDDICFSLSPNDLGILKTIREVPTVNIFNKNEREFRTVGLYKGELFLLYKIKFNPNKVFGLSINKRDDNERYEITFENRNYQCRYISEI